MNIRHSRRLNKQVKIILFLIFTIIIFPFINSQVAAHTPEKMTLTYDLNAHMLNVTITHIVSNTTNHYIKTVTVEKNNVLVLTKQYDSQPSTTTFTYSYPLVAIGGDELKVTAYCSISGFIQEKIIVPFYGENHPPASPTINGPSQGKPNVEYSFTFCSTDPDGDSIYYCVDWGDGSEEICVRPFPSGACVTISHSWTNEQTYKITAVAKDIKNAESQPTTHSITLPKSKINQVNNPIHIFLLIAHTFDKYVDNHFDIRNYYFPIFKLNMQNKISSIIC